MTNEKRPSDEAHAPTPRERFAKMGFDRVKLFAELKKDASIDRLMRGVSFKSNDLGATPVNQGEYSELLHVVLGGVYGVYRTEQGSESQRIGALRAGDWFGEASALSNQPSLYTIQAETDSVLVSVDAPTFKSIYNDRDENAFKALVDARYRERALSAHLRVVPLFKGLPESTLRDLQKQVELLVVEKDKVVAREGDVADAIYLVRSGAVKCTQVGANGATRIVGYFMDNSSFGERSLASGEPRWPGTFETMARTDIVKVPRAVLASVCSPAALEALATSAELIAQQETTGVAGAFDILGQAQREGGLSREKIEFMVSKQSVKGGHALVIDLTKCVRCNACVEACVSVHADRVPRLSKTGSRISLQKTLASACYHCEIPECMMACNFGAIRRDMRGSIEFVWDNCVGCTSCVSGCPYNVIRMTPPTNEIAPVDEVSVLANLPLIGNWFRSKHCSSDKPAGAAAPKHKVTGKEEKVAGKAIKCDLCAGMPFEACVYDCPTSAILRVAPEDAFERVPD